MKYYIGIDLGTTNSAIWDAWTPDAIEQRQEMLYQLSEEIWAIA